MHRMLAALLAVMLAASPPGAAQDAVSLRLNWYMGGAARAVLLGKERGYYARKASTSRSTKAAARPTPCRSSPPAPTRSASPTRRRVIATASKGADIKTVMSLLNTTGFSWSRSRKPASRRRRTSRARSSPSPPAIRSGSCSARSPRYNKLDMSKITLVQVDPAAKVVARAGEARRALLGGADDQYFLIK